MQDTNTILNKNKSFYLLKKIERIVDSLAFGVWALTKPKLQVGGEDCI
jgi:hypothetical protein